MYVQASGRLKADAVCTIFKVLLAIRQTVSCIEAQFVRKGRNNVGVRIWISKLLSRRRQEIIFSLYWSGRAISEILGAKRICA